MRITVGQFAVKSNAIEQNYLAMKALIKQAQSDDYDVIVFGSYALSGYGCGQHFYEQSLYDEIEAYTQQLLLLSDTITIIFGSIAYKQTVQEVVLNILHKHTLYEHAKGHLEDRPLKEADYFSPGKLEAFVMDELSLNIFFASDYHMLKSSASTFDPDYECIIIDAAVVNANKSLLGETIVYANLVGITQINKTVFINGGNSFTNRKEKSLAFKDPLSEGLLVEDLKPTQMITPLIALVNGLKYFSKDNFGENKKWMIGNSGGLDSAVCLALLSLAFGKDNVLSYNMSTQYNSEKTINNAAHLAEQLGVKHHAHRIDAAVDGYMETINTFGYTEIPTLAYENIMARTRGHLLGGFSSLEDAIICNNGNKLEVMLGYATLYGDAIGALSLIGDLTKVEVFKLAEAINEHFNREVIPTNLLPKRDGYTVHFDVAPSAELKHEQKDPMKWFYHDELTHLILKHSKSEILSMYLDNQFEHLDIGKWLAFYELDHGQNFVEDFEWFTKTFERNSFKRKQMPPVLVYSNKVIGIDFEDVNFPTPETDVEKQLKQAIIKKY